jgi:hypothetical protein
MNAVEIEQAVSALAEAPFDAPTFPFAFLEAFGNKETTIKRLKKGESNKSDVGGVLQANNIHIAVAELGCVTHKLTELRASLATSRHKARFILVTDGETVEAEELATNEIVAVPFADLPNKLGFFLPLAGITTVKQIRESSFDIRATSRLNRLYVELLKDNPDWGTAQRRPDMNHFMARLIFCFFAEDTDIFNGSGLFTATIEQMSARDASNAHEVIGEIFRAMNTKLQERAAAGIRPFAGVFPYVNGGLFSGSLDAPRFSRIARSYLLHIGHLDWTMINPDIFGSMIQAVADDEERGELGMHYTSVPNILKVLDPLFLDDLREKLTEAGDNARKLLNLRNRMAKIRVFDPACGSGNFLVIAYKEMRKIEAEINERRGEAGRATDIPVTNFRGIELRDFPAEIARLALIIAEYQADVLYRGQQLALAEFLPLSNENWIRCGNALRLDWLSLMDARGEGVRHHSDDLFHAASGQPEIGFENDSREIYICGNPPYLGSVMQSAEQKAELLAVFGDHTSGWKSLDYVAAWMFKAAMFGSQTGSRTAFVATNSICQGEQVPILWPLIFGLRQQIFFARTSFKWANLAAYNAGVTVVVVGLAAQSGIRKTLFAAGADGHETVAQVDNIGPYLISGPNLVVVPKSDAPSGRAKMIRGNMPNDGGHLVLSNAEGRALVKAYPCARPFVRDFVGSRELINSSPKCCLWIEDSELKAALACSPIAARVESVRAARLKGGQQARDNVGTPHRFVFAPHRDGNAIVVPRVSSENRDFLPVSVTDGHVIVSERNFVMYGAPLWNMALIASRVHWVWIGTVCVRMRTDFSYSNTLGWNTFPVPPFTDKNKADLTRCAEDILLAREAHFPKTMADLYDPETMPDDLRAAHDRNDETLERIYIGRRFRNDTERLEKLFDLYTKMVATASKPPAPTRPRRVRRVAAS